MANHDFDPKTAIQAILKLFKAAAVDEIEIEPNSPQEDQLQFVTSLPEAAGIIGYDIDRHILYLIDGKN